MTATDLTAIDRHSADRAVQAKVRLPLPIVVGNRDYREREALLRRMDELLVTSGVEALVVKHGIEQDEVKEHQPQRPLTDRHRDAVQTRARQALRCTVARILSSESHRQFSAHLAESPLLQWFCGCDSLSAIQVPSKSTLQRMEAGIPEPVIRRVNALLLGQAATIDHHGASVIGLAEPADLSTIWIDATCAKLDIHYPADWMLLRDGTRSIMRTILVLRRHGLKHRMPAPETFIATMNQHAMAMSGASRRGRGGDKSRARKKILRAMKQVVAKVLRHARRYRALLEKCRETTDLSPAEAKRITDRLDGFLCAMPAAVKQAHERIIGERIVPNHSKILSLYEPHAKVYVRGKAGADAEFGLQLVLGESADGLILDSHLVPHGVASDNTLLVPTIQRLRETHGPNVATTAVTDRGFASAANSAALLDLKIHDSTLPRSQQALTKKLQDPDQRRLHRRRAQTEARIGIFKANFLGAHLPTKGFPAQQRFVAWATLAHNLWVLARMDVAKADAAIAA